VRAVGGDVVTAAVAGLGNAGPLAAAGRAEEHAHALPAGQSGPAGAGAVSRSARRR
jgi:hypothetical protein